MGRRHKAQAGYRGRYTSAARRMCLELCPNLTPRGSPKGERGHSRPVYDPCVRLVEAIYQELYI